MNQQLRSYHDQLQQIDHEVRALVAGLNATQIGWQPTPKEWSVAHCIDHLAATNGRLVPRFEQAVQHLHERGWRSSGPFHYSWGERRFIAFLAPNAAPWLPAPAIYRPAPVPDGAKAFQRYMALEEQLLTCIENADGYDIGRVKVASPASALLRLRLGAWFAATVNHNRNHLQQAQRVWSDPRFPKQ